MGTICRVTGLTARAVRHYEAVGLIRIERDRENQRVFDAPARARLELVADLRRVGFGLEEITAVLALEAEPADHSALIASMLEACVDHLSALLEEAQRLMAHHTPEQRLAVAAG